MGVEIANDSGILRITFSGAITADDLATVVREVIVREGNSPASPNRLVDFGASGTVAVSFEHIATVASVRRQVALHNPIRTAIVVHNASQRGYARMFQTVNDHPLVTVQIFESHDEAEQWVGVPGGRPGADD
jgi:hypothetical protein